MTNAIIRNHHKSIVASAIADAHQARALRHAGLQGKVTEIVVSRLLAPLMPQYVGIGTGKLTDSLGNLSSETDVVLYARNVLPPMLYDERLGLFPVESVLLTIEVKSQSTADGIRESVRKAREAEAALKYSPGSYDASHRPETFAMATVANLYFAFGSDLSGKSELERYREYDPDADRNPAVRSICVVGQGYWWFDGNASVWRKSMTAEQNEEVIDFLAGIVNTIPSLLPRKGNPRFGAYIVKPNRSEEQ